MDYKVKEAKKQIEQVNKEAKVKEVNKEAKVKEAKKQIEQVNKETKVKEAKKQVEQVNKLKKIEESHLDSVNHEEVERLADLVCNNNDAHIIRKVINTLNLRLNTYTYCKK